MKAEELLARTVEVGGVEAQQVIRRVPDEGNALPIGRPAQIRVRTGERKRGFWVLRTLRNLVSPILALPKVRPDI